MNKFLVLCFVLSLGYNSATAQNLPAGFVTTNIGSNWSQPVGATFNKYGTELYVWDKSGKVYLSTRNGSGGYNKQTTPVIDISEEVGNWRDHGLVGFALDPDFVSNGYIYLLYVVDRHYLMNYGTPSYNPAANDEFSATIARLTRYTTTVSAGVRTANTASRKILLGQTPSKGIPILFESHGAGSLAFAADGMLLVSAGEAASYSVADGGTIFHTYYYQAMLDGIIRTAENVGAFRSQMVNSLSGKLLRIDPATGYGVSSNPFYSAAEPDAPKSKVWALGLRNPFRIAIKPNTGSPNPSTGDIGEVYIGDVGYSNREEINVVKEAGANFGWPLYEGHTLNSEYPNMHVANRDEPNPLYNGGSCDEFFQFKDLIKQATADRNTTLYNPCDNTQVITGSIPATNNNRFFHSRPVIDWIHYDKGTEANIGIFNGNNAAVAGIGTPASGVSGTAFSGSCAIGGTWYTGTTFPEPFRDSYLFGDLGGRWIKSMKMQSSDKAESVTDFGNGFINLVCIVQNPFPGDESLIVVEMGDGSNAPTIKKITYGGNQAPVAKVTADTTYAPSSSLQVSFTGNGSFDTDGNIPAGNYFWDFGDATTSTAINPVHIFTTADSNPKKFVAMLTVTDNGGASHTDSVIISLNNTPPKVNITSPIKNSLYRIAEDSVYACTATVTDAEQTSSGLTYEWQTFLRHNTHQHAETKDFNQVTSTRISRIGCNGDTYYWLVTLKVTDAAGLSTKDSTKIFPDCSIPGPLPIMLHKFSVTQATNENIVKWSTELEGDMEQFEVERSTDGVNFFAINKQNAKKEEGTSNYSYSDKNFTEGVNYYRLKITERGNTVRYSVIIRTVSQGGVAHLTIAPNPVVGNFSVSYTSPKEGMVTIKIKDVAGRIVQTLRENVNKGSNAIYIQNLPKWKSGVYFLSVENGNEIKETKFIKAQ